MGKASDGDRSEAFFASAVFRSRFCRVPCEPVKSENECFACFTGSGTQERNGERKLRGKRREDKYMEYRSFLDFLDKTEKLKCNTRHSWTSSGRHESVAEHSWRLALMAMLLGEQFSDLDRNKVIRMCLIHDLGEAVTGDIPAFVKTEKDEAVESKAVSGLFDTLPETQKKEMTELFAEMNALETREAKLYKSLDKLEALIQHNEADLATWLPLEYDLQMTYGTKECSFDPYINGLREVVREDSRRKAEEGGHSIPKA